MSEPPELPCSLWSVNPVNPNKAPSSQYRQQGTGPVGLPTVSGTGHVTRQRGTLLGSRSVRFRLEPFQVLSLV